MLHVQMMVEFNVSNDIPHTWIVYTSKAAFVSGSFKPSESEHFPIFTVNSILHFPRIQNKKDEETPCWLIKVHLLQLIA